MRRQPFLPITEFPDLERVQQQWRTIREEAKLAFDVLGTELGDQVGASWILPLVPEEEDRHKFDDRVYARACELAPTAARSASSIPYVLAYAFSKLAPRQTIAPHRHWNPYFTAGLCLQGGGHSHIVVGGQRRDFVDGELVVFDYRMTHEVANEGPVDRIVMLLLIDPRT